MYVPGCLSLVSVDTDIMLHPVFFWKGLAKEERNDTLPFQNDRLHMMNLSVWGFRSTSCLVKPKRSHNGNCFSKMLTRPNHLGHLITTLYWILKPTVTLGDPHLRTLPRSLMPGLDDAMLAILAMPIPFWTKGRESQEFQWDAIQAFARTNSGPATDWRDCWTMVPSGYVKIATKDDHF